VAGAVDVSVVTVFRLILNVRRRDGDAAGLLFRRAVNLVERLEPVTEILRDRCRQRRLAMVNVTNRADVYVRLITLKLLFAIFGSPFSFSPFRVNFSFGLRSGPAFRHWPGLPAN
jgi:hypothetical protein